MTRTGLLAATALSLLAFGACSRRTVGIRFISPAAWAQNIGIRTVSGTVLDAGSQPVPRATVFLQNDKTKTIRSFDSTADGHFHFSHRST